MILNSSRLSTVLIAGHFGNKLYQIPLDNTYQTYSVNTRAIAGLQKASPTCSVCTSSSAKHSTNGRMRVRANRTRLRPGSTRFCFCFCFCSILCRPPYAGLSLDIRRRNIAKGARPCLCHAAPPTAVGGAHNSPIAHSPLRVTLFITRVGSFTSPGIDTR